MTLDDGCLTISARTLLTNKWENLNFRFAKFKISGVVGFYVFLINESIEGF